MYCIFLPVIIFRVIVNKMKMKMKNIMKFLVSLVICQSMHLLASSFMGEERKRLKASDILGSFIA